eukprot:TRINITY_DN5298_c1_g1_i1.p1 TRINITY_DN5298_c1_g1~~TRINITY_DN5298_c1_g1_i1.p1  ORF type:complete len:606 (+),score=92.16 TRINITY_DN5298_c1_g1_i1:182-1999(+)
MNGNQPQSEEGSPPGMKYPPQATASQKAAAIFRLLDNRKVGQISAEDFRKGLQSKGVVPMLDASFVMKVAHISEPITIDTFQQWAEVFPIQVHVCHSCMNRTATDEELEAVLEELRQYMTENTNDEGVFTPPVPSTLESKFNPITPPTLQSPQFPTIETPDSFSARCTSDSALTSPHYQHSSLRPGASVADSTGVLNLVPVVVWFSDSQNVKHYRKVLLPRADRSGDLLKISVSIPNMSLPKIKRLLLYQQEGDWIPIKSDTILHEDSQLYLAVHSEKKTKERLKHISDQNGDSSQISSSLSPQSVSAVKVWSQELLNSIKPPATVNLTGISRLKDIDVLSSALRVPPSYVNSILLFDKHSHVWTMVPSTSAIPNNSDIYVTMLNESSLPRDPPELWYRRLAEKVVERGFIKQNGVPPPPVGSHVVRGPDVVQGPDMVGQNKAAILSYIEVLQQQHEYIGELKREQLRIHQSGSSTPRLQEEVAVPPPPAMLCYAQSGGSESEVKRLRYHKMSFSFDTATHGITVTPVDQVAPASTSVPLASIRTFCSHFDQDSQFCSSSVPGWELVLLEAPPIRFVFAMPSDQVTQWQRFLKNSVIGISTTPAA